MAQKPRPHKRMCMHCKRPFVFNDFMHFLMQLPVGSIACDICGEVNYLTGQKHRPLLLLITALLCILAAIPLLAGLWYFFAPIIYSETWHGVIFFIVPIAGFFVSSALINVIVRNYIWRTHMLSPRFESPFLDNLNR